MCTLSWTYHAQNHYTVYFNRDEQRSRVSAQTPQTLALDGVECVMPIDPQGGGTWISCNEHGVTVCLLNFYQGALPASTESVAPLTSRGLLVKRLANSNSCEVVDARLSMADLSHFAPFTLVSFDTVRHPKEILIWQWDGTHLSQHDAVAPIVSAAVDFEQAWSYRRSLYRETVEYYPAHQVGLRFHNFHDPEAPGLSPLMRRDDARTVSLTTVAVTKQSQQMTYYAIDDCHQVEFKVTQSCANLDVAQLGAVK